jgi:hypothetical protein
MALGAAPAGLVLRRHVADFLYPPTASAAVMLP